MAGEEQTSRREEDSTAQLEVFHHLLRYDPDTGLLHWKVSTSNRVKVGDWAGSLNPEGYIQVMVNGTIYKAHRLIWFMHYGYWPADTIDHWDRNRQNNRLDNLRDVTMLVNATNTGGHHDSACGMKGVAYDPKYRIKPWRVQISRRGKVVHRSHHTTQQEAANVATDVYAQLDA